MQITSNTSGITDLIARIQEAKMILPQLLVEAAQSAGDAVVGELSAAAPHGRGDGNPLPGDSSGPLAESFHAEAESQGNVAIVVVSTTQPLKLQYVTEGTGVYVGKGRIVPTNKQALMWPGAQHPYRSVAGQRANDFVSPVIEEAADTVAGEIQTAVEELQGILSGV